MTYHYYNNEIDNKQYHSLSSWYFSLHFNCQRRSSNMSWYSNISLLHDHEDEDHEGGHGHHGRRGPCDLVVEVRMLLLLLLNLLITIIKKFLDALRFV